MKKLFFLISLVFFISINGMSQKTDRQLPAVNTHGLWTLQWSPDDKYIAFGGDDSMLYIFTSANYSLIRTHKMKSMIRNVSWHPDGKILAIANIRDVQLLDMETDQLTAVAGLTTGGRGIGWNYTGEMLALADGAGVVQIISKNGQILRSIKKHNNHSYLALDWHPSRNEIVTSSDEIILFDTSGKQFKFIRHRKEHTGILSVKWHPSGEFFASGDYGHDGEGIPTLLQFWKPDGTLMKTLQGSKAEYRNIRWNKNGSMLATASDALRIWSKDGKLLVTSKTGYNLWGIDWNSTGRFILTAAFDGHVDLWKGNGQQVKKIVKREKNNGQ